MIRGSLLSPWLERSGTYDPRLEKTWIGHVDMFGSSTTDVEALIAVAGVVAEALDDDPETTAEQIVGDWEWDENSGPSATDRSLMSTEWWERRLEAVAITRAILVQHWKFLESVVAELIASDRVSRDRVVVLYALAQQPGV
jgi:hypothetical protein